MWNCSNNINIYHIVRAFIIIILVNESVENKFDLDHTDGAPTSWHNE